ncbi:MAG: metallophosphoesterase [Thermomicrobiales bacterium]
MTSVRPTLIALVVALALAGGALSTLAQSATPVSPSPVQRAWLEFGPDGVLQARTLTTDVCPALTLDGHDALMQPRGEPDASFPVIACEAVVPFGTQAASINDTALPLPSGPLERIAVIGDTGCRLNQWEKKYQNCNDPAEWPFAQVAESVAAWQPDLIIHVGDYLYRESPCPADMPGCAGSPHGDNWATWQADFLIPAAPLFPAAPLVMMRGNHETCDRNPDGWFRLFDPRAYETACQTYTDPYLVPLNGVTLAGLDSAEASDEKATPEEAKEYTREFGLIADTAPAGTWLVTHRPVWGVFTEEHRDTEGENAAYKAAIGDKLSANLDLIVSGHIHTAEAISFDEASNLPPQLISGNAGTALDTMPSGTPTGADLDDPEMEETEILDAFGFLTLEPGPHGWIATQRDAAGNPKAICPIGRDAAPCAAP